MDVKRVETVADLARCLAIRRAVFIDEQGVPEALEIDGDDNVCVHFLVVDAGPGGLIDVGTARLKKRERDGVVEGKVQRVAVVASRRRQGVGALLMAALEAEARTQGCSVVVLSSQVTAIPFYERLGYRAHGEVYDDAGLPHRDMQKLLLSSWPVSA